MSRLSLALPLFGIALLAMPARTEGPAAPDTKPGRAGGYAAAFDAALQKIGPITPEEFARRFADKAKYLERLSWDPTTARYWKELNLDPREFRPKGQRQPLGAIYDFRLNEQEQAVFKSNGFVVSERMGDSSCAKLFYRIYTRDLPVFISSDAVLHAWHRSYDAMLEELESSYLATSLEQILAKMVEAIPAAREQYGDGVLGPSVRDADYFLTVARSLLAGKPMDSALDQNARVAEAQKACAEQQLLEFKLFGRDRDVDFSQFKVRGHYEKSALLGRYFQAMMWCGRIDLRIAGDPKLASPRELGSALILNDLLRRSGKYEQWRQFDQLLHAFVGPTDSMTFAQLDVFLATVNLKSPADVKDLESLSAIQASILAGKHGFQQIRGDVYYSPPDSRKKVILPRSFTFLGQKFVLDSWVLSKVVYDDVFWQELKVQRRIPSALDAAFATFGNDAIVPDIAARLNAASGRRFRDGLNYQHNLAAARQVIDDLEPAAWEDNLYASWLALLRELSKPTTDPQFPEAMRSRAWAMKSLTTQLASWTELRHDTVLYAKQSYTSVPACSYPAGFVEPIPHFWKRFEKMALHAAALIEKTPYPDYLAEIRFYEFKDGKHVERTKLEKRDGKQLRERHVAFFRNFAAQTARLEELARKELAQREMSKDDLKFLDETVQLARHGSGSALHGGWYPGLFYPGREECLKWGALVADVHTDPPAEMVGDPGCVLHQGVGNVHLLVIAVDNGKDKMLYAGPVLSHYEFEMPGTTRKSDAEWRKEVSEGQAPPHPEWTKSYLVPGQNKQARSYPHGG
jgi:hypothetical protein